MATDSFFRQIKKIKNKEQYQNGFTVIELIVIVSIFAIMASVSLYNFQGFDDSTNINNLALDIALEIKRAQTLGSSSIDTDTGDKSAMSVIFSSESGGVFQQQFKIVREFPIAGSYGELGYVSSFFNAAKYVGNWYEIERFNYIFEDFLKCIVATYGPINSTFVSVHNQGVNM